MDSPHQYRINETVQEAIRDDMKALGGEGKASRIFFPEMNVGIAAGILRAWSLENRKERPNPDQLFLLMETARASVGVSEVARYFEFRLSCRITWVDPQDELQTLIQGNRDDFARIAQRQARIERALDRIETSATPPRPPGRSSE